MLGFEFVKKADSDSENPGNACGGFVWTGSFDCAWRFASLSAQTCSG